MSTDTDDGGVVFEAHRQGLDAKKTRKVREEMEEGVGISKSFKANGVDQDFLEIMLSGLVKHDCLFISTVSGVT